MAAILHCSHFGFRAKPLRVEPPVADRENAVCWMATACSKGLAGFLILMRLIEPRAKNKDEQPKRT